MLCFTVLVLFVTFCLFDGRASPRNFGCWSYFSTIDSFLVVTPDLRPNSGLDMCIRIFFILYCIASLHSGVLVTDSWKPRSPIVMHHHKGSVIDHRMRHIRASIICSLYWSFIDLCLHHISMDFFKLVCCLKDFLGVFPVFAVRWIKLFTHLRGDLISVIRALTSHTKRY